MKKRMYIHGDVLIKEIEGKPGKAKSFKDNAIVQEGEAHNHAHVFEGDFKLYKTDKSLPYPDIIEVGSEGATIKHINTDDKTKAEHNDICVDKGTYEIGQQALRDNANNLDVVVVD